MPQMDTSKYISAALAAIGAVALAASGYLTITTPEAQQCEINLAVANERVKSLTEATAACKTALQSCKE